MLGQPEPSTTAAPAPPRAGTGQPGRVAVTGNRLQQALARLDGAIAGFVERARRPEEPGLLVIPDLGPTCQVLLADAVLHTLEPTDRRRLLEHLLAHQDQGGAWLDSTGHPDLSATALGYWACLQGGIPATDERLVRAARVVHELGGAQRAHFGVRLWLAAAGQIPWSWLPAVPVELWLLPPSALFSPARIAPWARDVLTAYQVLAGGPAHLHLADARALLVCRSEGSPTLPRLTRAGLAGDLLQAFDRTVKVLRSLPRGPLPTLARRKIAADLAAGQQAHGGWFSSDATIFGLLALRVLGAQSHEAPVIAGLASLRRARGSADGGLVQGLGPTPLRQFARLLHGRPATASELDWLLRQELQQAGPWQRRADCAPGGFPGEAGANLHLDLLATTEVLELLAEIPSASPHAAVAWAARRRAIEAVLAMQEPDGGFARFERGESSVPLSVMPWRDADLLTASEPRSEARLALGARCLHQLGRAGMRLDDDRVARGVTWLETAARLRVESPSATTLSELARAVGLVCPPDHALRGRIETEVRNLQHEDGGFGDVTETARALIGLLALLPDKAEPCAQARRAAAALLAAVDRLERGEVLAPVRVEGHGLSPVLLDPSAPLCDAFAALRGFAAAGGRLD